MRILLLASLSILAAAGSLSAQEPGPAAPLRDSLPESTRATLPATITPDMWFYEQERLRHDSPKEAVRRKAEFRATQREHRLAAMEWFGLSNSRPTVSSTPLTGTYSPGWISNSHDPYRWRGNGSTTILVRPPGSLLY